MTRGALWAGLSALVTMTVMLVAGCTGSDPSPPLWPTSPVSPAAAPSPTGEPTPTPTVEALVPPERPAEMDRTDEVGAATAADYFLRLFAYVLVSGDLDEWNRVTIPDCEFCANAQSRVGAMAGNGRRLTGGAVALGAPEILGHDDVIGAYAVGVPYTFAAGAEVDAAGTTVRVIEQEEGYAVLDVVQSSEGWMLIEGSGGTEESE